MKQPKQLQLKALRGVSYREGYHSNMWWLPIGQQAQRTPSVCYSVQVWDADSTLTRYPTEVIGVIFRIGGGVVMFVEYILM